MNDERRRFYRIDDEISLVTEVITETEIDGRINDFWDNEHAFSIRNNYNFQIEQHNADFRQIDKKMPELARYLSVLEKQIDQITQRLTISDAELAWTSRSASISAQGIAYHCDTAPGPGSLLELNLKLLPSGFMLVILVRVVQLETGLVHSDGNNKISLDFEHIHEADREILIKHIHARQISSLGNAPTGES